MKEFLEFVVRRLVDYPDEVQISETSTDKETVYRLSLNPADIGLVIGKGGRTIGSIRSLLNAGAASGRHQAVEVVQNS